MSAPGPSTGQKRRRAPGELDPNKDLNTERGVSKRRPITYDGENAAAAMRGIERGTYDRTDVVALTDHNFSYTPAPARGFPTATDYEEADEEQDEPSELEEGEDDLPDDGMDEDMPDDDMADDGFTGHGMDPTGSDEGYDNHNDGSQFGAHPGSDEFLPPPFDPVAVGLKEINNLANFGVSSHKPGNGVEELLSDDLDKYWQSDGQQPHLLTVHFLRRVEIRAIRFYVDYNQDESYTPTHITFFAGTSDNDMHIFADLQMSNPVGWQDVGVNGSGSGPDGHSISCHVVQIHIKENHQNGKDTHIRGIKFYSLDEAAVAVGVAAGNALRNMDRGGNGADNTPNRDNAIKHPIDPAEVEPEALQELMDSMDYGQSRFAGHEDDLIPPSDFMRMPEIR
ncbi:hypothetical protein OQA88_11493 [Cercophora sp. LCS_1]